jgi:hypothetical protein
MAELVTVEGSIHPSVYLARGERKIVELTAGGKPDWAKLAREGFVTIVARHGDPQADLAAAKQTAKPAPGKPPAGTA